MIRISGFPGRPDDSGQRGSSIGAEHPNACALLTPTEIERWTGRAVAERTASESSGEGLLVSQCFYRSEAFDRSVSLAVTRSEAENGWAREQWSRMFSGTRNGRAERAKEAAAAAFGAPLPVHGVGDEAFWVGRGGTGALFAREEDAFLRVSVGGPGGVEEKIEIARHLAASALRRLRGWSTQEP